MALYVYRSSLGEMRSSFLLLLQFAFLMFALIVTVAKRPLIVGYLSSDFGMELTAAAMSLLLLLSYQRKSSDRAFASVPTTAP